MRMHPVRGEDLLSGEIFDQASLRSAKAQRFADAFAGCGDWIEPPPRRRRSREFGPFDGEAPEPFEADFGRTGLDRTDPYRRAA